jgi:DNA gyrase subunit B
MSSCLGVINKYAKAKNLMKDRDPQLLGEDIRTGLTAIVAVKLRDPQFEGQTKAKLGNASIRSMVHPGHQRKAGRVAGRTPR